MWYVVVMTATTAYVYGPFDTREQADDFRNQTAYEFARWDVRVIPHGAFIKP
jgi:hypothetical protein